MRHQVFFKLLAAFLAVVLTATLALDFAVRRYWRESLTNEVRRSLLTNTRQFALDVQELGLDTAPITLENLAKRHAKAAQVRATIIRASGVVLADSEADPGRMENHATRPEFITALHGAPGESIRHSATIKIDLMYVAVPVQGGAVRMAYPLSSLEETLGEVRRRLLQSSLLAVALSFVLAGVISFSVTRRLEGILDFAERTASGDLSARIARGGADELSRVAMALDRTAHTLEMNFSDLKSRRDELEALLNSLQEPVAAVDSEQRVRWANARMLALSAAGGKADAPLVEHIRDSELLRAVRKALDSRTVVTARVETGTPRRIFQATIAPMSAGGAVLALYEVTEIERVEKTRRDFIANVSHELRTPLTSIQGYTETLLEGDVPPAAREFLEIIHKHSARMTRLTQDLLVLARVESGEEEFHLHAVPAADLLEDARTGFAELARLQRHTLRVESVVATKVLADEDKVHQVFANLIENALKYSSTEGEVALGARDTDGSVEFYVRDQGIGVPSEHLPRLFERFYRVDKARSMESGGTGLGLAIVKHIVLKHNGQIRAESELNKGSTFYFTLPRAEKA